MQVSSYIGRQATKMQPARACAVTTVLRRGLATAPRRGSLLRQPRRRHFDNLALAILLPRRHLSTETNIGSGAGPAGPPPGFNPDAAKKPLRTEQTAKSPAPRSTTAQSTSSELQAARRGTPTSEAKSPATESTNLTQMAIEKDLAPTAGESLTDSKKEKKKKLTIMQKIKKEVLHYWDGTKLLATEVRISSKLALKMAAGYELSRREHRQLTRTVQDLGRLVPFSVFIIVPLGELLLPVALKIFPNLLPSTYEAQTSKDAKAKRLRSTRKEVSTLLRNTLKETGLPVSPATARKEEFTEFFRKLRATGESPTQEDVIKVCKIFKDDITLDNLSRAQLVGMARYLGLSTFGTDLLLRYQIRHRMRQIKRDDKAISFEGVESLSVSELQMACASRGIRTHGVSPARLRDDLQTWLDLRLRYGVPSTMLVLSNALMYNQGKDSEISSQIDVLTHVLSSIPEELFHEIELEVHNAEGAATNKQRLEVLKEQQELIEEENEQSEETADRPSHKDDQNIDDKDEPAKQVEEASQSSDPVSDADVDRDSSEPRAQSTGNAPDPRQNSSQEAQASAPTQTK